VTVVREKAADTLGVVRGKCPEGEPAFRQ